MVDGDGDDGSAYYSAALLHGVWLWLMSILSDGNLLSSFFLRKLASPIPTEYRQIPYFHYRLWKLC